jgi:hypothetical protein
VLITSTPQAKSAASRPRSSLFLGELPGHQAISPNDKITLLTGAR